MYISKCGEFMNDYLIKYNIQKNLQNIRRANGLRQEDIANALGINRSTYTSWELGRSVPKPAQLAELAKMFGCSVDFIINNHGDKIPVLNNDIPYKNDTQIYGDSYMIELTDEERALLLKFRLLNSKDKAALDDFIGNIRKDD